MTDLDLMTSVFDLCEVNHQVIHHTEHMKSLTVGGIHWRFGFWKGELQGARDVRDWIDGK